MSARWDSGYRRRLRLAVRTVPFYRELWQPGNGDNRTVSVTALDGEEFRLCPFVRPWRASREPTLWSGDPIALRDVLRMTGKLPAYGTVLEFRQALVDWRWLGLNGPDFGVLLSNDAPVAEDSLRDRHNRLTLRTAAAEGPVLLVGTPEQLAAARKWDVTGDLRPLVRQPVTAAADRSCLLVHDEHLGYLAGRHQECGEFHVNRRHFYVRRTAAGLAWTGLRRSRPTLVDVRPGGRWTLAGCARHGVPILVPGEENGPDDAHS
jgi:hypothetical protein